MLSFDAKNAPSYSADGPLLSTRSPWPLIALLVAVLIIIGTTGFAHYLEQKHTVEESAREQIRVIAELKAQQVGRWLEERRGNAAALALLQSPLGLALKDVITNPQALAKRQEDALAWLASLIEHYGYSAVALVNSSGKIILSAPPATMALDDQTRAFIERALVKREVAFSDTYEGGAPHLDIIVPLLTEPQGGEPLGALLLRIDPKELLLPIIQLWPTPSRSGETALVRHTGNGLVVLGESRHHSNPSPSLPPLSDLPQVLAARDFEDKTDVMNGIDYRGAEVMAAIRQIPESSWYILTTMDRQEIDATIQRHAARTGLTTVLLMLIAGLLAWLAWRRQAEAALLGTTHILEARVKERATEQEAANASLIQESAERKQAEQEIERLNRDLKRRLDELQTLFDVAPIGIAVAHDPECRVITTNPAGEAMLSAGRHQNVSKSAPQAEQLPFKVLHNGRELAPEELPMQYAAAHDRAVRNLELNVLHSDGRVLTLFEYASPLHDEHGKVRGCLGLFVDITERKRAEEQLRLWSQVIEVTRNGIIITDPTQQDNPIIAANPAFERITGYSAEEVLGRNCRFLSGDDRDQPELEILRAALREQKECQVTLRNYRKDGSLFWNELFIAPVRDRNGAVTHYIGVQTDITEHKAYEAQLKYQANYDSLTQLPNRTLLQDRLTHGIAHAQRAERLVAVLFLDLDRFKMVNDSLGHGVGDALLQAVAARLVASVREGDTVARLGGDEFVIVLEDLPQEELAAMMARKALQVMETPFKVDEQEFFINCSVGISLFPKDGKDVPSLLKNADTALHRAKEQGRNSVCFYSAEMNAQVIERLTLEHGLRYAFEELELYYQPQVDLKSGQVIGVEALLRWRHPELGMISPATFIPLAEETGMIVPIGEWALRQACAQAKVWQVMGLPPLTVSVNLSARQFLQAGLADKVMQILQETGLEPSGLELEITESLLMQDVEGAIVTLQTLKAMGVHLTIDDFGIGYSSLNYLKRFPIDRLKIDQSFVSDITTNPDDAAIALVVIAMAHGLRRRVIAEGVETEAQLSFLRSRDCDEMQGFYFSRPLPVEELTKLLLEDRRLIVESNKDQAERS